MEKIKFYLSFFTMILYAPVHEFGHWIAAYLMDVKISSISLTYITVNELEFTTPLHLIIFKSAGLLITFYPSLLFFSYLWRSNSNWWQIPYIWIVTAPIVSLRDLIDIGTILGNNVLKQSLMNTSVISTLFLFTVYAYVTFTGHEHMRAMNLYIKEKRL